MVDSGFQVLERLMQMTRMRHGILASNIANSDTPGYRARDVNFKTELKGQSLKLQTTDSAHMAAPKAGAGVQQEILLRPREPWADGNNVEVDVEVARMTENSLLYEASVRLLSIKMKMFRNAITGGRF